MRKDYVDNIVIYARHRIASAPCESIDAKIEWTKRLSCGFRNRYLPVKRSISLFRFESALQTVPFVEPMFQWDRTSYMLGQPVKWPEVA